MTAAYGPYMGRALDLPDQTFMEKIHPSIHFFLDVLVDLDRLTMLLHSDPSADDVSDKVIRSWNALYRATARAEGLENRIKSGKAFNGGV